MPNFNTDKETKNKSFFLIILKKKQEIVFVNLCMMMKRAIKYKFHSKFVRTGHWSPWPACSDSAADSCSSFE